MIAQISGLGKYSMGSSDDQPVIYAIIAGYDGPRRGILVSLVRLVCSRVSRGRGHDIASVSVDSNASRLSGRITWAWGGEVEEVGRDDHSLDLEQMMGPHRLWWALWFFFVVVKIATMRCKLLLVNLFNFLRGKTFSPGYYYYFSILND